MSLRNLSLGAVIGIGLIWILLVLVVGLPQVLRSFAGGTTNGGMAGLSFGPREMLLVALVAFVPPLLLLVTRAVVRRT